MKGNLKLMEHVCKKIIQWIAQFVEDFIDRYVWCIAMFVLVVYTIVIGVIVRAVWTSF